MRNNRTLAAIGGVVVALAIAGGAYAFTPSNTVPATTVGEGSGETSGYTITSVHYHLSAAVPGNIDSLTFTINPAVPNGGSGKVVIAAALSTGGPTNYTCDTDTAGTSVTCATLSPHLTASSVDGITVVAAQ